MVKSCGCKIVEIGHAERYKYFNETDILVNKKIILAYEPVWAIGKNNAASAIYVSETIKIIREYFVKKLNFSQNQIIIIYGGSVNKLNAKKLLKISDLDGIFIGRSAINANNFIDICKLA